MFATLDAVLADLDTRGELLRIRRSVDSKFELAAVLQAAQRADNRAVLFEKVKDTRFTVVSNVFGSYERVARVLGVEPSSVARRWAEVIEGRTGVVGETADEAVPYEEVSIHELPQLTFCEKDAGPYLTASVIVARDEETGRLNASYHRMQIIDDGELRCRLSPSGDLFRLHARGEARGEALPAVVLLGAPPPLMLASAATVGPDLSEVEVAERILGRHLPRVECRSAGLVVPAGAPVMIEGEILAGVRKPEGPFGEWMDYYVPVTENHVFRVRRV
ncbi:MAG: UbiD family decarboxylase domain-containing protein, partial [Actinomycetota bacterium]